MSLQIEKLSEGKLYKCILTDMKVLVYLIKPKSPGILDRCFGRYFDVKDQIYRQTSIKDGQLEDL